MAKQITIIITALIIGAVIGLGGGYCLFNNKTVRQTLGSVSPVIVTITNYKTETNYYSISKVQLSNLTNIFDLTNIEVVKVFKTNKINITNIVEIFTDYSGFWESPFIWSQTNDNITVSLFKRSDNHKIRMARNRVYLYYPLILSYAYNVGYNIDVAGYIGYINSNVVFGIGAGYEF